MSTRDSWEGKRVRLRHKDTGEETTGEIVSDPPERETRFKTDDGRHVGAYEWFYSLEET